MSTKNFKAMLAEAKRPERTIEVCMRGDLAAEHQELERRLDRAQKAPTAGMEDGGVSELADHIETLQQQMLEHSYTFRLRALPRHEFRSLVHAHPPREKDGERDPEDAPLGVNRETFFPAIIRASVYDPELDDAEWTDLLDDKLTDYQFQDLAWTAWHLNDGEVSVPFSRAALLLRRDSGDDSKQPSGSE